MTKPPNRVPTTAGAAFLAMRTRNTAKPALDLFRSVLVVDDNALGLRRMLATVRLVMSPATKVVTATTLGQAFDHLIADPATDLILLNDFLQSPDTALTTIPFIRRLYSGPIIVNSEQKESKRVREILRLGAAAFIHLDDLDSQTLVDAMTMAAAWKPKV